MTLGKLKLSIIKELNRRVAVRVTLLFGTMGAVYSFLCWSILPLIFPDTQAIVFYVSGGVIQLVALPLIMVGSNILSEKAEIRAEQDHKMIMEQFEIAKHMREEADKQRGRVIELLAEIQALQNEAMNQRLRLLDTVGRLIKLQEHADQERETLAKINQSEYDELLAIKEMHQDIHELLGKNQGGRRKKQT